MKTSVAIVIGLAAAALAAVLVSAAGAAVQHVTGQPDGDVRTVSARLDLQALARGTLAWHAVYETSTPVMDAWRHYARRHAVTPQSGIDAVGACMALHGSGFFARRTITVQLCSRGRTTRVAVNHAIRLAP